MESTRRKKVLCPIPNEKSGKTYWLRVGSAFVNKDGSTNVYLDAYPSNGKLQIRDMDERDLQPRGSNDDGPRGADFRDRSSDRDGDSLPF